MIEFNIGDVVVLKSHPYFDSLHTVIFGGEPQFVSPLMVIIETLAETQDKFDEKNGEAVSIKGRAQCKCFWYSSKAHQFEESWIMSTMLKPVETAMRKQQTPNDDLIKKNLINKLAILKTADLELAKQKSSVSIETSSVNSPKDKNTINPLLTFVAPVVQIIQISEFRPADKDMSYDTKTGAKKRINSKWLAKCKWYNPNDKLSEKLIPLECLNILPTINTDLIEQIAEKIETRGFYSTNDSIIQPKSLLYINGYYHIKAYDYVKNKTVDLRIEDDSIFKDITSYFNFKEPTFDFKNGDKLPENYFISNLIAAINLALKKTQFIRIQYTSRLGIASFRTVKDYELINIDEGGLTVSYLKGYCMSKRENRYFKLERIQELQVLNITF